MLFSFDKKTKKISLYKQTDFRSHQIFERQDIEKWVEKNPEILGEELLVLTTEYDQFDKTKERLDLIALDRAGNLVIIELKRDDTGKTAELQAIKYAAYCSNLTREKVARLFQEYLSKKEKSINLEAAKNTIDEFIQDDEFEEFNDKPRIILVAKEFSPEVTSTVLWLRKFKIDITCVKLTPYEINDSTLGFESSVIIPLPEAKKYLIEAEEKEDVEHSLSLSQEEYLSFYKELRHRLADILLLTLPEPLPRSYYQIPAAKGAVHFEWAFHGRPRSSFGVELHFERAVKELNEKLIDHLEKLRTQIEEHTGESPVIQRDWGRAWARLYIEKMEGQMTEELKNWAVEKMAIFYKLLKPELEKIK